MEQFDFSNNKMAEIAYIRLLLHKKGLSYESADMALDYYELQRRLENEFERALLLNYGFENIADDIYNKMPLGNQWQEYEAKLFNLKELAVSKSRYYLLAQAFEQRHFSISQDESKVMY